MVSCCGDWVLFMIFKETKMWCIAHDLMNNYGRKQVFFVLSEMLKEAYFWKMLIKSSFEVSDAFSTSISQNCSDVKLEILSRLPAPTFFPLKLFLVRNLNSVQSKMNKQESGKQALRSENWFFTAVGLSSSLRKWLLLF